MKNWYNSKIFMLALVGVLVFGGNALAKYLTSNGVTPEQIQVVEKIAPQVSEQLKKLQEGANVMDALGVFFMAAIAIFRAFFYEGKIQFQDRNRNRL